MKNFQQQYAGGTATGIDFMNVLNETSGVDFTGFFDTWYFGEGYPIYNINWEQEAGVFEVSSLQRGSAPEITSFFEMNVPYKLYFTDGSDTTISLFQTENENSFSVPLEKNIDSIQIDPDRWVLIDVESVNGNTELKVDSQFLVFPNPADSELTIIVNNVKEYEISITDLNGKVSIKRISKQPITVLNVYSLQTGTYIVNIKTNKDLYSQKFIKN